MVTEVLHIMLTSGSVAEVRKEGGKAVSTQD